MIDTTHQAATVHQAVLQLVLQRLQQVDGLPADHVHQERAVPVDAEDCPAVNLMAAEARFEGLGSDGLHDLLKASVQFTLRVYTRGTPHTVHADPVIGLAHRAVMADPSLGGYALRLRILTSRPQQEPAAGTAGVYELGYEVTVCVSESDLALVPVSDPV